MPSKLPMCCPVLTSGTIDSHGGARLHSYFEMLSIGRINPKTPNRNSSLELEYGDCRWGQRSRIGCRADGKLHRHGYGREIRFRLGKRAKYQSFRHRWLLCSQGPRARPHWLGHDEFNKAGCTVMGSEPLGSDRENGGHKGYCLAVLVDMLTCVLSGANWGPFAPPFALRQETPERNFKFVHRGAVAAVKRFHPFGVQEQQVM